MFIVLMSIQSNSTSIKTVTRRKRRKRKKTQKRTTLFPVQPVNQTNTSELISDKTVSINYNERNTYVLRTDIITL